MPYGSDPTEPQKQVGYGKDPTAPPTAEKIYYNEAGQPFTASGKPPPAQPAPADPGYTGSLLPFRRDDKGLHLAVPEAIASPVRGAVQMGERARGVGEAGQNPLRPLSPDALATVGTLAGSPVAGAGIGRGIAGAGKYVATADEKFIKDQYTRAVKPTVSGKATSAQVGQYQDRARSAISSIVENKSSLRFTDEAGNIRQGELPKTLEEFGDAIDQTKQKIFDQYDTMARQATNTGFEITGPNAQYASLRVTVPTNEIVSELQQIATDRVTSLTHPEIAQYARDVAARYSQAGSLSPSEAQRAIATFNQTLKAFYRNPSYQVAAKANVDAMIVKQLRDALDQTIESSVGPGYQELKNQYGALKGIEKDVTHRAQIVGRQEKGGGILGRIADVGSAEEVIRGLITLNPAAVARGVGLKAWAEYVKFRRSPNRAVSRLFEEAEKPQAAGPKGPELPRLSIGHLGPYLAMHPERQTEPWKEVVPDAR